MTVFPILPTLHDTSVNFRAPGFKEGLFPRTSSDSAIPSGCNGRQQRLFHGSPKAHGHGVLLGGGMVGKAAVAVEVGADAFDIDHAIRLHPHPTTG